MSRWPIIAVETLRVKAFKEDEDKVKRMPFRARIDTPYGALDIFVLHLSFVKTQQCRNVYEIVRFVQQCAEAGVPQVLVEGQHQSVRDACPAKELEAMLEGGQRARRMAQEYGFGVSGKGHHRGARAVLRSLLRIGAQDRLVTQMYTVEDADADDGAGIALEGQAIEVGGNDQLGECRSLYSATSSSSATLFLTLSAGDMRSTSRMPSR